MFWDSFDMGNDEPVVDPLEAVKAQLEKQLCWGNSQQYDKTAGMVACGYMSKPTEFFVGELANIFIQVKEGEATVDDGYYSFPGYPRHLLWINGGAPTITTKEWYFDQKVTPWEDMEVQ